MSSLTITPRRTRSGPRFVVRYRLGGRAYPIVHGGSFRTLKEAKARRDLIAKEIANGRNPAETLRWQAPERLSLAQWRERFLASLLDVDERTTRSYRFALQRAGAYFGDTTDPLALRVEDITAYVASISSELAPGTVRHYVSVLRSLLDFVDCQPNPARDRHVRLPKQAQEEVQPPPAEHVQAILAALSERYRLLFATVEQGALRIGEAISLSWGDVDANGLRLRLSRRATKGNRARWVYLPEWLMDAITATCAVEDRTPERRVFQGLTEAAAGAAMTRACKLAQIPHYHPHDLRHRRISIWHNSGIPARELAHRAGHSKASMSLDVYSHVMPVDEVPSKRFLELIADGRS